MAKSSLVRLRMLQLNGHGDSLETIQLLAVDLFFGGAVLLAFTHLFITFRLWTILRLKT